MEKAVEVKTVPTAVVKTEVKPIEVKQHTAAELSGALAGSPLERREETRTITLTMKPGIRPEVVFVGFWEGRSLKAAMNSIAKAYRVRKLKAMYAQPPAKTTLPGATQDTKSLPKTVGVEGGK